MRKDDVIMYAILLAAFILLTIVGIVALADTITHNDIVFNARIRNVSQAQVIRDLYNPYTVICPRSSRPDRVHVIIPQSDVLATAKARHIPIDQVEDFLVLRLHCRNWNHRPESQRFNCILRRHGCSLETFNYDHQQSEKPPNV